VKRVSSLFVICLLIFMLAGCPSVQTKKDPTLKALLFNSLAVPDFDPDITDYTIVLPIGTNEVPTITTIPNVEGVTIEVINAETLPGTTTIIVTALDGKTVTTYHIYFTVQKNNDSSLKALEYNDMPVPGFKYDKLDYEIILPAGTSDLPTISATASDSNAAITITQVLKLPGTAEVTVTAEDGVTTSTYSIYFIPRYFIAATSNPSDGGTITGAGNYVLGTQVNLIATPNEGYEFVDWTDNGVQVSTSASYSFTADADRTLLANFKLKTYKLTTIVFGQGTVGKTPDNEIYSYGDVVQLTANPEQGWYFTGWSGDISGSVNPAIIIMEKNKTVGATFAANEYKIIATAGNGGNISPSGSVIVNHGENKTFTITPNEGYSIEDLIVDGQSVGPDNSYTFNNVTAEHTIHAIFSSAPSTTYTVTINVSDDQGAVEGASVSFNGETKNTDSLGKAVFTDVLAGSKAYTVSKEGYNDATDNLLVDGDKTVDVFLAKKTYTLAINLVGQGIVTRNPDKATYSHGEIVQLTAHPLEGSFAGWGGDISGSENPINITMKDNMNVTATFEAIPQYVLTIGKTGNGTVTADPAPNTSGKYTAGTDVTLTAEADAGWQFVKWVVGETEKTENPVVVKMDADKTVEAVFEEEEPPVDEYTLTITKTGQGTVVPAEGVHEYDEGSEVALSATPADGWDFSKWVIDGTDVLSAETIVIMSSNRTANAVFVEEEPPVGPFPEVTYFSFTTTNFMVLQPCTENLEIRFQVAVDDPESELVAAEYKVTHVASGEFFAVEIPEDNWGFPWTYTVSETLLNSKFVPLNGGKYDITVTATNTEGNATSKTISFYVKQYVSPSFDAIDVGIVDSAEDQIEKADGLCVVTSDGLPGTVEATFTYDSKITVRVYLIEKDAVDGIIGMLEDENTELIVEEQFLTDELTTEQVTIGLPDLRDYMEPGVEYKLLVVLFTPECGALGCVDCGIEAYKLVDCDFIEDIDPTLGYTITLVVNPVDGGLVSGGGTYNSGDEVTVVATPNEGKYFINWTESGIEVSKEPFYTFTATNDRNLVANFGTGIPPEFEKLLPANGAVDQPLNVKLEWNAVDPDGTPVTYDVYFGYSASNLNKVLESTNLNEYYPDVIKGFTFYWKVVASNGSATKDSGVMAFSTIEEVLTDKSVHIIDDFIAKQPSEPVAMVVQVKGIGTVSGSEIEIEINTDYMEFVNIDDQTLAEFLAANPGMTYEDFEPWCEYKATETSFLGIKKLKDTTGSAVSLSGAYTNSTGRSIADGDLWFVYVRTKNNTGKAVAGFSSVSFIDAEFNEIPVDSSDEGLFIVR